MKKLLTLAVALAVSAAFTGLSAAQERMRPLPSPEERKAVEKSSAIATPNTVTLSATKNMASLKGCPVTAWVGYKKLPVGGPPPVPTPGYTVTFKVVPSGPIIGTGVSGANGNTSSFTVPWTTTIQATITTTTPPLASNAFPCGEGPASAK